MGTALPDSRSSLHSPGVVAHDLQRMASGPSVLPPRFGPQQISPFAGQAVTNNPGYNPYPPQYASPYPQLPPTALPYAQSPTGAQAHSGGVSQIQASYVGQQYLPNQAQPYMYYPGQYGQMIGQPQGFQSHPGPYSPMYNRVPSLPYTSGYFPQQEPDPNIMGGKIQAYSKISPGPTTNIEFNSSESYLRPGSGAGK